MLSGANQAPKTVSIEQIRVEFARLIRHQVLRPNEPFESVIYAEDKSFDAQHFGAFLPKEFVGAASIYKESLPPRTSDETADVWRLRGMAVLPAHQNKGIGKRLLLECTEFIKKQNGRILWCNARTSAANFYLTANFEIIGGEFEIPKIGAHFLMRLDLI